MSLCRYSSSHMSRNTAIYDPTFNVHTWCRSSRLARNYIFLMAMTTIHSPPLPPPATRKKKSIFFLTILTSSHSSKNLPSDTTAKICNTGPGSLCGTSAGRTTAGVGYGNVHTTSAGSGRSSPGNSPSAGAAGGRSTVARNARRAPGSSTAIGVCKPLNNTTFSLGIWTQLWLDVGQTNRKRTNDFPNSLMKRQHSHDTSHQRSMHHSIGTMERSGPSLPTISSTRWGTKMKYSCNCISVAFFPFPFLDQGTRE